MPPLPDHANVLRVKFGWQFNDGATPSSSLHFLYAGPAPSDAECASISGVIIASAVTNLVPVLGTDKDLASVLVQDLSSPTAGVGETAELTTGTASGGELPASVCALMNLVISRRYRGGKPRVYWPFGTASNLDTDGLWDTGPLAGFQEAVQLLVDDVFAISGGGFSISNLVSVSNYAGFTPVTNPITGRTRDVPTVRSAAIAPDIAGSFSFNKVPGSQRRRLVRP